MQEVRAQGLEPDSPYTFLIKLFEHAQSSSIKQPAFAGLLYPTAPGYIVRADILPLRLVDCEILDDITPFLRPRQYYHGVGAGSADFHTLLRAAAGGFRVRETMDLQNPEDVLAAVVSHLQPRLSLCWTIPHASNRTRIAVVEGGRSTPEQGGIATSLYPAAQALGLEVVVVDGPGHWLQSDQYENWREAFLPVELDPAGNVLTQKLIGVLGGYPLRIDGIITFCDSYQASVAEAAQKLGLPFSSPEGYRIATNKYLATKATGRKVHHGFTDTRFEQDDVSFPAIIKPCKGWGSEGVFKVNNHDELTNAIQQIDTERHETEFMVEEYCDGPEVDVNMVLYEGELMFYEISDDYPKSAEGNKTGSLSTFIEMDSVHPTNLPERECEVLRDTFHQTLLQMGLLNGVFHVEGRIQHSSMKYGMNREGLLDLVPDEQSGRGQPMAWMLDPNPRPPGMTASLAPQTTYGIEYYGLSLLIALRDTDRVHALSRPFVNRNQYWCVMVYIPTDYDSNKKGIVDTEDICASLKARRPDLAPYISNCLSLVKKGERVPHPERTGVNTWVAYFNVFSRQSRSHALELARKIRESIEVSFL